MNRGGAVITVAAVLAVLAAGAVFLFLSGVQHNAQTGGGGTVKVIVAKQDIAVGTRLDTVLTDGGVTYQTVPKDSAVRGAVTDLSQIKGQTTSQPIVAGQQLSTAFLEGSTTQPAGGPHGICEGCEAITLSLQAPQAGGGLVQNGDHVQVFASFENLSINVIQKAGLLTGQVQQTELKVGDVIVTVVPDVTVLQVLQDPITAASQAAQIQMTLELKPEDAAKLVFANSNGTVWFGLLPPNQQGETQKPISYLDLVKPDQLRPV
jgi:Flp pilus assembly protein CpaB